MPEKNFTTASGIIGAHFNIEEAGVKALQADGFDNETVIGILIIKTGSYLTLDEITLMLNEDRNLNDIASEIGISEEIITERTQKIIQAINKQ